MPHAKRGSHYSGMLIHCDRIYFFFKTRKASTLNFMWNPPIFKCCHFIFWTLYTPNKTYLQASCGQWTTIHDLQGKVTKSEKDKESILLRLTHPQLPPTSRLSFTGMWEGRIMLSLLQRVTHPTPGWRQGTRRHDRNDCRNLNAIYFYRVPPIGSSFDLFLYTESFCLYGFFLTPTTKSSTLQTPARCPTI